MLQALLDAGGSLRPAHLHGYTPLHVLATARVGDVGARLQVVLRDPRSDLRATVHGHTPAALARASGRLEAAAAIEAEVRQEFVDTPLPFLAIHLPVTPPRLQHPLLHCMRVCVLPPPLSLLCPGMCKGQVDGGAASVDGHGGARVPVAHCTGCVQSLGQGVVCGQLQQRLLYGG